MATLQTYTPTAQKKTASSVSEDIFGLQKVNHNLLKLAYEYHLAEKRSNLAQTKTRSAVRGGGRKPHQQKGTGRARAGSIRSPLWRGGGVVFGPTGQENYKKKMNKKARSQALKQGLSLKKDCFLVLTSWPKDGKTATLAQLLKKLKLNRRILLLDTELQTEMQRASSNLPEVSYQKVNYLNTLKVLNTDFLIFSPPALVALQARLGISEITKEEI